MVELGFLYISFLYLFYMVKKKSVIAPAQLIMLIGLLFLSDPLLQTKNTENYIDFILVNIFVASVSLIFVFELVSQQTLVSKKNKLVSVKWLLVAQSIFFLELLKRVFSSEFNLNLLFINHLLPRGSAPWDVAQFAGAAHYALLKAFLPFAALVIFNQLIKQRNFYKFIYYICVYFILLVFIASSGSRAPLLFVILASTLLYIRDKTFFIKVRASIISLIIIFVIGSIMVTTRGIGYSEMSVGKLFDSSVHFHVDNNYTLAKYAISKAVQGHEPWSLFLFLGSIVFNSIPRAIWPQKPAFYEDDYGIYKENWWTTISFIGELAALTPNFFIVQSVFFLIFIYSIARYAYKYYNNDVGFIFYMCVCFYLHLCSRSLFSIGTAVYLPALVFVLTRIKKLDD